MRNGAKRHPFWKRPSNPVLIRKEVFRIIHSFLLIGQSNMAGRGFIEEAAAVNAAGIRVLRNGRWQPFYRPVNGDRSVSGVSLAESFAESYARDHGVTAGLIPCADGGTSLSQWREGGLLFDHAVYQARLAMRTSTIAGVLWHQGESDCDEALYPLYADRLTAILRAFRRELNLYDVPFLLGGLGDFLPECTQNPRLTPGFANYVKVNGALRQVAGAEEMTGYVPAEGLSANPDNLHFSAAALHEFGLRYYEVFRTLERGDKIFPEKPDPDSALRTGMELL